MPYRVLRDQDGAPHLILSDEPAYCHALAADGTAREPELGAGLWLLMAFAVWSAPDVAAVQAALELARGLGGELQLGLRPYDDPDELRAWWPGIPPDAHGPFWLLLRDGVVCRSRTGVYTADELRRALLS